MEITEIQVEGYERVARARDAESGLAAFIAVHDTTLGPALGGMRMLPYPSDEEALFDVLRLAKGMTYKSAIAETGLGGGKSVILGDPKQMKSPALFRAMGRFIESLKGLYITAEDMNIGERDLEHVRESTRWVVGLTREKGGSGNPSPYTARGCLLGMKAVLEEIYGSAEFRQKRVLMQGVGAVGGALAVVLKEQGAEVTICDINEKRVDELRGKYGFKSVPDAGHQGIECDIYAPCARGAVLNDETIPQLRCKAIAGCANNQLLDTRHAQVLKDRGILYAPDYVINAGGIINVSVELLPGGYVEETSLRKIEGIYTNLKKVFEVSRTKNVTTLDAAARIAEERLRRARAKQA